MLSTISHRSSCELALGFTTEALLILDRVEREIMRQERIFGHERLLRVISSFGVEAYNTHTSYYRRVIRETIWPHGTWVAGGHADFLRGFEHSSLGYVWGGFEALYFFAGSSEWSIDEVYDDALVAESLRGQFGKSSPDGLDRRLEQLEDAFLASYGDEEDLVVLCTPVPPILPAETAMVEDFADFRRVFPTPPTIADVLNLEQRDSITVWRFLRRHVRWNVSAIAPLYDGFANAIPMSANPTRVAEHKWRRDRIISKLSGAAIALVDAITSLNVLNLVLEPSFSFKGCVGLPLGMVFRLMQHVEQRPALDQIQLLIGKCNLFSLATLRRRDG